MGIFDGRIDGKRAGIALEKHCIFLPRIQPQKPDRTPDSEILRFRGTKDGPFVHHPPRLALFSLDFFAFALDEIGPWTGQIGCESCPNPPSERRKLTFRPLKGRWMDVRYTLLGRFVYHKWNIPQVVMVPRRLCGANSSAKGRANFCRRPITNRDESAETASGLRVLAKSEAISRMSRIGSEKPKALR